MSHSTPPAPFACAEPVERACAPRWFVGLAILALAGYAVFLAANATNAAGGSDSAGYLNSARLLASGHLQDELRVPAEFGPHSGLDRDLFTPFGFDSFLDHVAAIPPTYPMGLPLHIAGASKLVGWRLAPFCVEIAGALAAVWLCYLTARELGVRPSLAAAGAAALGGCPIFVFTSLQPISDTLATTWTLAAVVAALHTRRHPGWAVACGAAFAVAVLVRSTNAVLLPALIVFLGFDWRRLALFVVGGIPGAVWLGYYNHTLYGGALRSGYGTIYRDFSPIYVPSALLDFAYWLALLLPAILLLLPLAAPTLREFRNRHLIALGLWFGATIALFACVKFSHESWWSLRYILPAVPALIVTALLGLEALAHRFPSSQRPALLTAAAAFLALWTIVSSVYWTRKLSVFYVKVYEQAYADASLLARTTFPEGSLVVSGATCGALYFYTDFPMLRADLIDAPGFAKFSALAHAAGRPVCALLFEIEENEFRAHCPGEWQRVAAVRNLGLWRLIPSAVAPSTTPAPAQ